MTVDFMCQLDWIRGYPHIWSDIILDESVRMFLERLILESID